MPDKIIIHTDGGSRGNPGPAAIGIVIYDENHQVLEKYKECIGDNTNNSAEYLALIKALSMGCKHTRKEVQIFLDSELVIRHINGRYRITKPHLLILFKLVKDAEKPYKSVTYTHVPRTNKYQVEADKLVNEALDEK